MKVRQGFVSNSSTTSFCVYGYEIEPNEPRFFKDDETMKFWIERLGSADDIQEDYDSKQLAELLNECLYYGAPNAKHGNGEWDDPSIYVGRVMGRGDPMDTEKVLAEVREFYQIPDDAKPSWFEDAWRDG